MKKCYFITVFFLVLILGSCTQKDKISLNYSILVKIIIEHEMSVKGYFLPLPVDTIGTVRKRTNIKIFVNPMLSNLPFGEDQTEQIKKVANNLGDLVVTKNHGENLTIDIKELKKIENISIVEKLEYDKKSNIRNWLDPKLVERNFTGYFMFSKPVLIKSEKGYEVVIGVIYNCGRLCGFSDIYSLVKRDESFEINYYGNLF